MKGRGFTGKSCRVMTHPFLFFVRVQLVVHGLDHTSSADTHKHTQGTESPSWPQLAGKGMEGKLLLVWSNGSTSALKVQSATYRDLH